MIREVRFDSTGDAQITYGSSKESSSASGSSSSNSSTQSQGEEQRHIEYKHKGTSRERVIKMMYSFPDGSSKVLDYE